jgi:hypothetical protein
VRALMGPECEVRVLMREDGSVGLVMSVLYVDDHGMEGNLM